MNTIYIQYIQYIYIVYIVYIYIHGRSIIFPNKEVEVTKKFFSQSCTNILETLTENSAPQAKIESSGLLDTLKLSSKQKKLQTVAAECYYYCCCYCYYYYYYLNKPNHKIVSYSYTINVKYTVYIVQFRVQDWGLSYSRPNSLPTYPNCFERIQNSDKAKITICINTSIYLQ